MDKVIRILIENNLIDNLVKCYKTSSIKKYLLKLEKPTKTFRKRYAIRRQLDARLLCSCNIGNDDLGLIFIDDISLGLTIEFIRTLYSSNQKFIEYTARRLIEEKKNPSIYEKDVGILVRIFSQYILDFFGQQLKKTLHEINAKRYEKLKTSTSPNYVESPICEEVYYDLLVALLRTGLSKLVRQCKNGNCHQSIKTFMMFVNVHYFKLRVKNNKNMKKDLDPIEYTIYNLAEKLKSIISKQMFLLLLSECDTNQDNKFECVTKKIMNPEEMSDVTLKHIILKIRPKLREEIANELISITKMLQY